MMQKIITFFYLKHIDRTRYLKHKDILMINMAIIVLTQMAEKDKLVIRAAISFAFSRKILLFEDFSKSCHLYFN
jgi:uncharacterized protein YydD (DUF2326 family)